VANFGNSSITKFDSTGAPTIFAPPFSVTNPLGLAFDSADSLYAATSTPSILKFDRSGNSTNFTNQGLSSPAFIAVKLASPLVGTLKVTAVSRPATNHFVVTGKSLPNALVTIQAAPNLQTNFAPIGTATADTAGVFQYDDNTALAMRFYRALYP
jgi:hypothetical protein